MGKIRWQIYRQVTTFTKGTRPSRPTKPRSTFNKRSALTLYSGLLFWGLLATWVLLNLLVAGVPAKLNIDVSDDQIYSLSETSQKILQGLQQQVKIYALFTQGRRPTKPMDIYRYLQLYQSSSPYVSIEEIDPALEPQRIRPFITGTGRISAKGNKQYSGRGSNKAPKENSLIVFRPDGRFRIIHYSDLYYVMRRFGPRNAGIRAEQQISSAIAYVNGANVARLGLLHGHGEHSLAPISPSFEQFNIQAQNVELLQGIESLKEVDVLLVYKPQLDLSPREYQYLRQFLGYLDGAPSKDQDKQNEEQLAKSTTKGGKALWLVLDFQAEHLPNFYQLAKDYGIEILEGLILERDRTRITAANGNTTFVTPIRALPKPSQNEELHSIVRPLRDNKISDLLWVQSMAVRESYPHAKRLRFYNLVESSGSSLLRSSRDPSSQQKLNDDIDGPLTLMGLSVWQNEQGKRSGPALLVSFDVPGARSVFSTPSNQQLFYSALSWLGRSDAADENLLVFPNKSLLMLPLRLSQTQAVGWAIAFVLLLPTVLLLAGLLLLRQRKRL